MTKEEIIKDVEKAISNIEDIAVHKDNKISKNLEIYDSIDRLRSKINELKNLKC